MSLTSILKEIERVDRKQSEVYLRYNGSKKGCPRQEDLQREEQEDQHIFGYSHSQMLAMFHHGKPGPDQTRPCTAADAHTAADTRTVFAATRPQTALDLHHAQARPYTGMPRAAMRRAQSAVKGSYRQQFNFLFKEDIFDENHEKMRRTQPLREQNCESNQRKMSRMLVQRSVPRTVTKMHSQSIKAERNNFIKSFDQNLARLQGAKRKKLNKVAKNQIFYSRSTFPASPEQREQPEDFFRLTKAAERQAKKIKVVLSNSVDNLREVQSLMNQGESEQLADFRRESSVGRYPSLLETNFLTYLPPRFTLTCVIPHSLQSARLPLAVRNNTLSLEDSREAVNLGHVFEQLLANHPMVHLIFHSEGSLLYEETLVAQPYRNMQSKEHEILLLMYYLKRFLLLDPTATLQSVRQSTDLLLKSNLDLPDDFADFTQTFEGKLCRVYDTDQRHYQFALGAALANGLASVTAFKKEMGFGQKVVKLKHGTREQFKKYLYNWEYFYICPSLSPYHLPYITCSGYHQLSQTLFMKAAAKNESVKVALRVRPLNKRETEMNSPLCVETKDNILSIRKGAADIKDFVFDYVFGIQSRQEEVYKACGYSLVENALEGFNGTIFAYGQTGAGKTFTMVGDYKDPEWQGIIPRGFEHVITAIQTTEDRKYVVRASFIEIYNEEIFDLLDMKGDVKKDLKESPQTGVFIKDLKTVAVKSVDEMFKLLDYGNKNRSVAKTNMNATSSRSHALFTVHIESIENEKIKASKLNFVDLAGSERQGKTGASGDTLKEGAKINLSLTALGNVINSLVDGKKGGHIPYRDSKLTRLLQDSLGGNTKTLMVASVSPAEDNYDETVSTLRYAARARNIKNSPHVNEDPKDTLIKEYMAEIEKLRKQLSNGGVIEVSETSEELMQELESAKEKAKELTQKEAELLEMKLKMKEMEELIMKKEKDTPEMADKAKKRKNQKKKIMKQEELNEFKVQQLEKEEENQLEETQAEDKKDDINYWKNLAKKLKRKLKSAVQDKKDQCQEFQDERQRLNECIRNLQINLSFYQQVAEKFLSESDLAALKDQSTFNYETRVMIIPPFLLHDEKLSLPKTLKKHEVDDLWKEKRKGCKLELIQEALPDLGNNKSNLLDIPESKSNVFSKDYREPTTSPILQNRRILKYINYNDEKYKEKDFNLEQSRETFFRRTNFLIRENSNSTNKRPPSASKKFSSKTKLESISSKEKTSQERPLSKGRERLEPIIKK